MRVLTCPTCGGVGTKPAPYCPDCGAAWPAASNTALGLPEPGEWRELPLASSPHRIGAYALDALFVGALQLFQFPGIGEILGMIGTAYMLMRDMNGASLGKLALGLRVVREDGSEASTSRRILRNLPLSLANLPILLPMFGLDVIITSATVGLVSLLEGIFLLTTRRRIGDRLAGTVVIGRASALAAQAVKL